MNPEDIFWSLQFGRPKKKLSVYELRSAQYKHIPAPVFFLSTGRCGTKWFSSLLEKSKDVVVLHDPVPNLGVQGTVVYDILKTTHWKLSEIQNRLIGEIFWAAREQYIRYSYKSSKRLIETNNSITFFADVVAELFSEAKFVHIYRHPGEFVRSAIRRGYFSVNNPEDIKRIKTSNEENLGIGWETMSGLQKSAWLWKETNLFIEKFKTRIAEDRIFVLNFNEMDQGKLTELLDYLNIDLQPKTINKHLKRKENIQQSGNFPIYNDWSEEQKDQLRTICGELAGKYGYNL